MNVKTCAECDLAPPEFKKGKVPTRKLLNKFTRAIGTFLKDYYLPSINQYKYHLPHVIILSKLHCGAMWQAQYESVPYSLKTIRDYAERVKPELNFEAQLDKFGNPWDLSLEGSSVSSYSGVSLQQFREGTILKDDLIRKKVFMSHLSDKSEQDAGTTYNNMCKEYEQLKAWGELAKYKTIDFNNTDGCTAQYRCYRAMYLLSMLAIRFAIIIDRAVGAPGNGKDEVDGLNAIDKRYLQTKMRVVTTPGEEDPQEDRKMRAYAMVENENFSMAEECYRLLSSPDRQNGVTSDTKHAKRESAKKVKSRVYFLQKHEDVEHDNLKCTGKLLTGVGKHNGIRSMYNVRADPDLGVGYNAVRRIPCGCKVCTQQILAPWDPTKLFEDQPRYKKKQECKYWNNFRGLNEWQLVKLAMTKATSEDDVVFAHAEVLIDHATRMADEVEVGKYGAFSTNDERYKEGYYLVEWTDEPFTLQEDIQLHEYDPPARIQSGELVCKAKYFEQVPRAKFWHTPTVYETTVRMKNVLSADVNLLPISAENVPRGLSRKSREEVERQGAMQVSEEENEQLRHRITNLDLLDHDDPDYAEFAGDEEQDGDEEDVEEQEEDSENEK
jgi:hypothetical protein